MERTEGAELTERQRYRLEKLQACESEGKSLLSYAAEQGFHVGEDLCGEKDVDSLRGIAADLGYVVSTRTNGSGMDHAIDLIEARAAAASG